MYYNEYGEPLPFFYYAWKQPDAEQGLSSFKKKFGSIGKLIHGCSVYSPNKTDDSYALEPENEDVYKQYYEALKKSVNDNKDYLLDLVKDKKIIHPDFRKIDI